MERTGLFAIGCLIVSALAWYRPAPSQAQINLLDRLKTIDRLYASGLTMTGTDLYEAGYPDVPLQKTRWQISLRDGEFALEQEPVEIYERAQKEPPPGLAGTTPTMMMKRVVYIGPKRSGHHFIFGAVTAPGPAPKLQDNMKSGQVLLHSPDSDYFILAKNRYLWSIGRGYSDYLDEVIGVTTDQNGVLALTARGRSLSRVPGQWELEVNPQAMYMVQAAQFRRSDSQGNLSAKPEVMIRCEGTRWVGSLCLPERTSFTGLGQEQVSPLTFESLKPEADEAFLREADRFLDPPYEVQTTHSIRSAEPPIDSIFKPGELYENAEKDAAALLAERASPSSPSPCSVATGSDEGSEKSGAGSPATGAAEGKGKNRRILGGTGRPRWALAPACATAGLILSLMAVVLYVRGVRHER